MSHKRTPRKQQRLGKIEELIIGKDGNLRGAKLVAVSKSGNRSIAYRPIRKLVHFEIYYKSKESAHKEKDEVNENEVEADNGISLI